MAVRLKRNTEGSQGNYLSFSLITDSTRGNGIEEVMTGND